MLKPINLRQNNSSVTDRLPSPAIWDSCPILAIKEGKCDGIYVLEDFVSFSDEDGADSEWERYIDTGNTIRNVATNTTALATGLRGGVVRLSLDASDNDGPAMQYQHANGAAPFLIGNTSGAAWKLWYECRVKKSSITDNQCSFFAGLAQVNAAADDGILADNSGDIVDSISAIGFRVLHDNGEELDFAWQDAAQTSPVEVANMAALVADTWVKLGFLYDPDGHQNKKIKLFVNNAEYATGVTLANIDAATFPENDAMTPIFCAKNGEATATTFDIDWVRCVQVYELP